MIKIPTRLHLSLFNAVLLFSIIFVLTQNIAFWVEFGRLMTFDSARSYLFTASVSLVLCSGLVIILSLLLWSRLTYPMLAVLLVLSTLFNYYSYHYQIYMDRDMLTNVIETNTLEVYDLISFKMLSWLIIGAVIPFLMLTRIKIKPAKWWQNGLQRLGLIMGAIIVVGGIALVFYKDYASFFRNHRQIVKLIMPSSYITSYVSYARKNYAQNMPYTTIGDDAVLDAKKNQKKTLFIMVVGETARKNNFSLNGYEKNTNSLLSQQENLVSFQNVVSCGTATAISVPCMFSQLTRDDFDKITAEHQDNALDIAQKAGYKILWRENDHGCKGVCIRLPTEDVADYAVKTGDSGSFYYDESLLENLDQYIDQQKNSDDNLMVVLHMNGSHGPTYYQRYPKQHKKFSPSCETSKIETCDGDTLANTYDNTIAYTDYVLNETIELLKQYSGDYDVAMLYVSDHGESLGESGFYLHGAPYAIAPKEQIEIPLIFWSNSEFMAQRNINLSCLNDRANNSQYSHDNIFHTLLGLLQVKTNVYQKDLNIFKEC